MRVVLLAAPRDCKKHKIFSKFFEANFKFFLLFAALGVGQSISVKDATFVIFY